jgi:hypothetical protein
MSESPSWYILKNVTGTCDILSEPEISQDEATKCWGPFTSKSEAIARRVGLIRSGKCQPL